MTYSYTASDRNLMTLGRVAQIAALSQSIINELVVLRLIAPAGKASDGCDLFSPDQASQIKILAAMNDLDYQLGQMRDMVTVMDLLDTEALSPLVGLYQMRLSTFIQSLALRSVAGKSQLIAQSVLVETLEQRYTWLV